MALVDIDDTAYDKGSDRLHRRRTSRAMHNIPHPKRELMKLCARIGYTPH